MKRILFLLAFLLPQQSPPVPPTASIEGSISRLGTSDVIPRAKVTLSVVRIAQCSDRYC